MRLSNSKAQSNVKRYLLTSYKVNDVTNCASRNDNDNVTLMAQGAEHYLNLRLNLNNAQIVFSSQ